MEGVTPHRACYEQNPVAVIYFYRTTKCTQTHAMSLELWHQGEKLAFIAPVHCLRLRQTQVNLWLHQAISKLSHTYRFDLRELIYSFTLHPSECPLQPCLASFSITSDDVEQTNLTKAEIQHGEWFNIWSYQRFYANLFATYAGISDQDAIELLYQLQEAGYVRLGRQLCDLLPVKAHAFVFDRKRKGYTADPEKVIALSQRARQDARVQAGHNFTSYQKIWTTASHLTTFKVRDIVACTEVSSSITKMYLNQLHQIGYFQVLQDPLAGPDDEVEIYRFIRNSGTTAPLVCSSGVTCDMNNPQTIYKRS